VRSDLTPQAASRTQLWVAEAIIFLTPHYHLALGSLTHRKKDSCLRPRPITGPSDDVECLWFSRVHQSPNSGPRCATEQMRR